jgi:anaerobic magnesium-protoporphyrin IX monomethyl ester cyclase
MRIDLLHPPVFQNPRAVTGLRPAPPLGLAYVAASLERAGHRVRVVDAIAEAPDAVEREGAVVRLGLSPEQMVERIAPDVEAIGLSNMWSFSWPLVRGLLHRIRARFPHVPIVCGGEHFNGLPELSMQQAPIDFIVRGEGEEAAVELFAAIERERATGVPFDRSAIGLLAWRNGDGIVLNERRGRTLAVDDLPRPAWHLFDLRTYYDHRLMNGIDYGYSIPILATRGCPYSCTYCASPGMWGTKWIARDPVAVVDEIEHYVREYGANNFPMQDLTAIIRRDWVIAFCREIIARGLDVRWQFPSGTRCEVIDDEVAAHFHRSGCHSLAYAPESGSEETRRLIQKRMKREALMAAVDAAARQGINLTAFIVIGFPHDTDANLRANLPFVRELARRGVEDLAMSFFFPIPATALYDQLVRAGRVAPTDEHLLAPLCGQEWSLSPSRNFCASVPGWRLTAWRYLILLNFYLVAIVTHPWRLVRHVRNFLTGREQSKLESGLRIVRTHVGRRVRRAFGRRPAAPAHPA